MNASPVGVGNYPENLPSILDIQNLHVVMLIVNAAWETCKRYWVKIVNGAVYNYPCKRTCSL